MVINIKKIGYYQILIIFIFLLTECGLENTRNGQQKDKINYLKENSDSLKITAKDFKKKLKKADNLLMNFNKEISTSLNKKNDSLFLLKSEFKINKHIIKYLIYSRKIINKPYLQEMEILNIRNLTS
jgi:hypothetical protein